MADDGNDPKGWAAMLHGYTLSLYAVLKFLEKERVIPRGESAVWIERGIQSLPGTVRPELLVGLHGLLIALKAPQDLPGPDLRQALEVIQGGLSRSEPSAPRESREKTPIRLVDPMPGEPPPEDPKPT